MIHQIGLNQKHVYTHSVWYLEPPARSASRAYDACEISVGSSEIAGPYVSYFPNNQAACIGDNVILLVHDRESFRVAWRHARLWRINGIARHLFGHPQFATGGSA
jgi:hypothetical protein